MNYEDLRKFQRMERNATSLANIHPSFYTGLQELVNEHIRQYESTNSIENLKMLENIRKISRDIFDRREQKILMRSLRCIRTKETESSNIVEYENELFNELLRSLRHNRVKFEQCLSGNGVTELPPHKKLEAAENLLEKTPPEVEKPAEEVPAKVEEPAEQPAEPKIEEPAEQPAEETVEQKKMPHEVVGEKLIQFKDGIKSKAEDLNTVLVRILKNIPKFVSSDMEELGPYKANEIKKLPEKEAKLLSEKEFVELI